MHGTLNRGRDVNGDTNGRYHRNSIVWSTCVSDHHSQRVGSTRPLPRTHVENVFSCSHGPLIGVRLRVDALIDHSSIRLIELTSIIMVEIIKKLRARAFSGKVQITQAAERAWVAKLKADVCSYPTRYARLVIGGAELAPTTGMRHIHFYVEFTYQRSSPALRALMHMTELKPWFIAANRSDRDRIIEHHCKVLTKEDPLVRTLMNYPDHLVKSSDESVEPPIKRVKVTQDDIRAAVETGNIENVKQLGYMTYIKCKGALEAECARFRPKTPDIKHTHLWVVGPTGSGKTAYIMRTWPNAYQKDLCNPNFEEYNNESIVVMDDMDNKRLRHMTVGKLKNLCNPAGTRCKVNYGTVFVKAQIIVTSQYTIEECFKHKGKKQFVSRDDEIVENIKDDPDYQAIARRFDQVNIRDLLFQANLQLKSKGDIAALTPEQSAAYDLFEPYDIEKRNCDAYSECNRSWGTLQPDTMSTVSTQTVDPQDAFDAKYRILNTVRAMEAGTHVLVGER